MRTVTFQSVLYGAAELDGIDPKRELLENQSRTLTGFINLLVRRAWKREEWGEIVRLEERTVATDSDFYVPLSATGKTTIDDPIDVYASSPRATTRARRLDWVLSVNGIQLLPGQAIPTTVWVRFWPAPPEFTAEHHNVERTYAVGERVYYPTTGECYTCISPSTAYLPTNTAYWSKIDFPAIFAPYVKLGAHAMSSGESSGDEETKDSKMADAEDFLADELDLVFSRQRQVSFVNRSRA